MNYLPTFSSKNVGVSGPRKTMDHEEVPFPLNIKTSNRLVRMSKDKNVGRVDTETTMK